MTRIKDTLAGIIAFIFTIDKEEFSHSKVKHAQDVNKNDIESSKDSAEIREIENDRT